MFLDRCDICHKPKKCKGYNDTIICDDCIEQLKQNNEYVRNKITPIEDKTNEDLRTTIFDFIE